MRAWSALVIVAFLGAPSVAVASKCGGVGPADSPVPDQPRNVRYVEHLHHAHGYQLRRGRWPVPGRVSDGPVRGLLTIERSRPLAADQTYAISWRRADIVTFRTKDISDTSPPEGGALLGAAWSYRGHPGPEPSIALIHSPVTDGSQLYAVVESWTEARTERVTTDFAFEGTGWRPTGANIPDIRDDDAYVARIHRVLRQLPAADAGRAAVVYQSPDPGGCGVRRSARFAIASSRTEDTLLLRTRWIDAAGNTTPWSGTVRIPAGAEDGDVLVGSPAGD